MITDFIKGLFGKSSREEVYKLTDDEMAVIRNTIERRVAEQEMERITRVMTTDAVKKDSNFWTVSVDYEEKRVDDKGKQDIASVGCKSISKDLDMAISDAFFTLSTILAPVGGDLFLLREQKEALDKS